MYFNNVIWPSGVLSVNQIGISMTLRPVLKHQLLSKFQKFQSFLPQRDRRTNFVSFDKKVSYFFEHVKMENIFRNPRNLFPFQQCLF